MSHRVASRLVMSRLVMSRHVTSRRVMCRVARHVLLSCHVASRHIASRHRRRACRRSACLCGARGDGLLLPACLGGPQAAGVSRVPLNTAGRRPPSSPRASVRPAVPSACAGRGGRRASTRQGRAGPLRSTGRPASFSSPTCLCGPWAAACRVSQSAGAEKGGPLLSVVSCRALRHRLGWVLSGNNV